MRQSQADRYFRHRTRNKAHYCNNMLLQWMKDVQRRPDCQCRNGIFTSVTHEPDGLASMSKPDTIMCRLHGTAATKASCKPFSAGKDSTCSRCAGVSCTHGPCCLSWPGPIRQVPGEGQTRQPRASAKQHTLVQIILMFATCMPPSAAPALPCPPTPASHIDSPAAGCPACLAPVPGPCCTPTPAASSCQPGSCGSPPLSPAGPPPQAPSTSGSPACGPA